MTDATPKTPESAARPKRTRKPKKSGKPKKKTAEQRQAAHHRGADLAGVRAKPDSIQRQIGEAALTRQWIDAKHLAKEPRLQTSMWPGYRFLSPLERTEQFGRDYVASYRRVYGKHIDPVKATLLIPLQPDLARNSPDEINALARARLEADRLGMPYDIYCDVVMEGLVAEDKWERPPRPNQMYGKLTRPRLRGRPTAQEVADRLYGPAWDARFFADVEEGDPAHRAARSLLHGNVLAADDPVARLSMYMMERKAISETRARTLFGDSLVDAAVALGGHPTAAKAPPTGAAPYRPSCFGYLTKTDTSPCHACAFATDCRERVDAVRDVLLSVTGSSDPRLAQKRANNAERQKRLRDRRRADRK